MLWLGVISMKHYKVEMMVAELVNHATKEIIAKKDRKYRPKTVSVIASCVSDALTKAGRQMGSQELTIESFKVIN